MERNRSVSRRVLHDGTPLAFVAALSSGLLLWTAPAVPVFGSIGIATICLLQVIAAYVGAYLSVMALIRDWLRIGRIVQYIVYLLPCLLLSGWLLSVRYGHALSYIAGAFVISVLIGAILGVPNWWSHRKIARAMRDIR